MKHLAQVCTFDKEHAVEYGVNGAIFLSHIFFWLSVNRDANRNYHQGKFWTYNTVKSYSEIFPFWSEKQIRTIIQKLEKQGAIVSSKFNRKNFDNTKWYTLSDKLYPLEFRKELTTTDIDGEELPNGQVEKSEKAKRGNHSDPCLPKWAGPLPKKANQDCPNGQANTSRVPLEKLSRETSKGIEFYLGIIKDEWGYQDIDIEACVSWVKKNRKMIGNPLAFLADKIETMKYVLTQVSIEKEVMLKREKADRRKEFGLVSNRNDGLGPLDISAGLSDCIKHLTACNGK